MTQPSRKHINTILVYQEGFSEPNGIFVSIFDQRVGLSVTGGGDAEVWLSLVECKELLTSLKAVLFRVKEEKQYETFSDLHLQQVDDYGVQVPAVVLISDHCGEIGLYIAIKGNGGGQVWMEANDCQKVLVALESAIELLKPDKL